MNAHVIRRYLQPSPTLRWHPWAPLITAGVLVALVFILGAQWGYSAGKREVRKLEQYSYAFMVPMEQKPPFPARDMARKAGVIDAAVVKFVGEARERPGTWQGVTGAAERWVFRGGRALYVMPRESIVYLAEYRLRELSGSATAWQVTATYCAESAPVLSGVDLRNPIAADAYSTLLGRPIAAEQLAPAVPHARCEPPRRTQ